ncbi:UTRA domain-containing protein [Streptacidiphilus sp. NEAU-YB345]|uniref:UTRA domain-containing protein n=1 Tax=Streptacidiphilus fuscans TaxID=2789292 RepID=A0A931FGM6_9ACTN|nr:UTRA domain-containing protein [Streptacidiphilus fuscans]
MTLRTGRAQVTVRLVACRVWSETQSVAVPSRAEPGSGWARGSALEGTEVGGSVGGYWVTAEVPPAVVGDERTRAQTVRDAVQTLEPTVANPDQADLLDVPVYAPLLQTQRTTRDTTGRVVEFTRSVYRGDRYRITSHLHFDHNSG